MLVTLGLALVAGILSVVSPCVLPLLPIVLGTAAGEHRFGPAALAGGLALSFVVIGLFVATIGFSIGLDGDVFRTGAALVLIAIGLVLVAPPLQARFAVAAGSLGGWTEQQFGGFAPSGLGGQFAVGLLLGAVWSPCVGPTLGAASILAAQSQELPQVAATMVVFGVGAASPLLLLGMASREALLRWRHRLRATGNGVKIALGALLIVMGVSIVTGLDKSIETALVDVSPLWLTDLTTRF